MTSKGAKARTAQKEGSSKKKEGRRWLQNGVPYTVEDRVRLGQSKSNTFLQQCVNETIKDNAASE